MLKRKYRQIYLMSYDGTWQGWLLVLGGGCCCCALPLAVAGVCRTGDGPWFGTTRKLRTWVCRPSFPKACFAAQGIGAAAAPSPRGCLFIAVRKSSL